MTRRVAWMIAVVSLTTVLAGQQSPAPPADLPDVTFTVEVNYVEVDAAVSDASGGAVKNLRADDFELLEDGKPQKISSFSFVDVPVERRERPLFAAQPIEPDVFGNGGTEGFFVASGLYLTVGQDLIDRRLVLAPPNRVLHLILLVGHRPLEQTRELRL